MEIEATTTEIIMPVTGSPAQRALDDTAFGIRPQTGRPHSINLFGSRQEAAGKLMSRGADLLLGIGVGAVLMYYLDKNRGPGRRTELGGAIQDLALTMLARVARRSPDR